MVWFEAMDNDVSPFTCQFIRFISPATCLERLISKKLGRQAAGLAENAWLKACSPEGLTNRLGKQTGQAFRAGGTKRLPWRLGVFRAGSLGRNGPQGWRPAL